MQLGSTTISKLMLGTTAVSRAYLGTAEVWGLGANLVDPISLSPAAWYDVSRQTGTTGSNVTTLTDFSGNARHATGLMRIDAAIQNGLRALRATGATNGPYAVPVIRAGYGGLHIYVVSLRLASQLTAGVYQRLFSSWDGVTANDYTAPSFNLTGVYGAGGVSIAYPARITATSRAAGPLNLMAIGKNRQWPNEFFQGYLCEVLIFDRVLPAAENASMVAYLNSKWAIV